MISSMQFLSRLDWGIMIDSRSMNELPNSRNNIPFTRISLSAVDEQLNVINPNDVGDLGGNKVQVVSRDQEDNECVADEIVKNTSVTESCELISINRLITRLGQCLPSTKIHVFGVPVLAAKP